MRLNLTRHNCNHLGLRGQFNVSKETDDEVLSFLDQTETHIHRHEEDDSTYAFFGSRSQVAGMTYRVQGSLQRSVDADGVRSIELIVTNNLARDTLRRPPSGIRPVSDLIEASERLFGVFEVTCNATFEYNETQGYRSTMRLPFGLIVPENTVGITHIEAAQFSRRVGDIVEYRIAISDDSDSFTHKIGFEKTIRFGNRSLAELLVIAKRISTQFIELNGGENDVNG